MDKSFGRPIAAEIFGPGKYKHFTLDYQLIISDKKSHAQEVHLDSTAALLTIAIYFHTTDDIVKTTTFFKMGSSKFGDLRDLNLEIRENAEKLKLPWDDRKTYPILSDTFYPNGTMCAFAANVLHRGPGNQTQKHTNHKIYMVVVSCLLRKHYVA